MGSNDRIRRLPLALGLAPGESLPSYLQRLAADLNLPVGILYRSLGLAEGQSGAIRQLSGLTLPARSRENLIRATALDTGSVQEALLERYVGNVFSPSPMRPLLDGAIDGWIYAVGSHCCPSCLAESSGELGHPSWKLAWKLPWFFACTWHETLLAGSCPICSIRLGGVAPDGGTAFAPTRLRLPPGRCIGPPSPKGTSQERLCGHNLAAILCPEVPPGGRVFKAQKTLEALVGGAAAEVASVESTPLSFLNDLRALCSLMLHYTELEDLRGLPSFAREAFAVHVERRDRLRMPDAALANEPRRRLRVYEHPPNEPALMAVIATRGVEMLEAHSVAELADRIAVLLDRAQHGSKHTLRNVLDGYTLSEPLRAALNLHRRRRGPLPARLRRASAATAIAISVEEIPQLFWLDLYEEHLAGLFSRGNVDYARRFCSIALALTVGGATTVAQAVDGLELPASAVTTTYEWRRRLAADGQLDAFQRRIEALLPVVAARDRPDLAERRRKLRDFVEVHPAEWSKLCADVALGPGRPVNRRYAAAWLWADITGGDCRLAPAAVSLVIDGKRPNQVTERVRRFARSPRGQRLAPALRGYGTLLLRLPCCLRSGDAFPKHPCDGPRRPSAVSSGPASLGHGRQ